MAPRCIPKNGTNLLHGPKMVPDAVPVPVQAGEMFGIDR